MRRSVSSRRERTAVARYAPVAWTVPPIFPLVSGYVARRAAIPPDRPGKSLNKRDPTRSGGGVGKAREADAAAAGLLGFIHRGVRAPQQRSGALARPFRERDADAGTDLGMAARADHDRRAHARDDVRRDVLRLVDALDARQHHHEFVSAHASDHV